MLVWLDDEQGRSWSAFAGFYKSKMKVDFVWRGLLLGKIHLLHEYAGCGYESLRLIRWSYMLEDTFSRSKALWLKVEIPSTYPFTMMFSTSLSITLSSRHTHSGLNRI